MGTPPPERGKIGTQRRVRTAGGGGPGGLAVEGAQRHDFTRGRETIARLPVQPPAPTPAMAHGRCLDQGEADDAGRAVRAECGCTAPIRARGEEAKALQQDAGFRARRGVVERPPRGLHRFRRVLLCGDKHVRHELGFLHWVCADSTYRQAGLLG